AQPVRLLRIVKVVDIAPVGRGRLALCLFAQQRLNLAVPAGAARPQRIDVVALAAHPHRQTYRLDRALLADEAGHLFKFAGQRERQVVRSAAMAEKRRRQRLSEGKDPPIDASCGCRISVTATVLRRCVRHRTSRLPLINEPRITPSTSLGNDKSLSPRAKGGWSGQFPEPER